MPLNESFRSGEENLEYRSVETKIRVNSIEELLAVIGEMDSIQGGHKVYRSSEVVNRIRNYQAARTSEILNSITNSHGIREEVRRLVGSPEDEGYAKRVFKKAKDIFKN